MSKAEVRRKHSAGSTLRAVAALGFTHIEQWIDEPFGREGKDLLNKIGQTIDRHCDEDAEIDGVIFCFAGHGLATKFKGQDGETFCAYDAVLEAEHRQTARHAQAGRMGLLPLQGKRPGA